MSVTVRLLRPDELRTYLEIVGRSIRGLACSYYSAEAIEGWVPKINDETLGDLESNNEGELRLIAEVNGTPTGIAALVVERSELRACYVVPEAARRGCGSALVREVERLAKERGLTRLELAGALNSEMFYTSLGYRVRERGEVVLKNGHRLTCVWMEKHL